MTFTNRETHQYFAAGSGEQHERRWHTYPSGNTAVFDRHTDSNGETYVWATRYDEQQNKRLSWHEFASWH